MDSDCTLRFGFNAFIKSTSYTKQSNLFLNFLSTLKRFSSSFVQFRAKIALNAVISMILFIFSLYSYHPETIIKYFATNL